MDAMLREVLQAVGVLDWLREQFPDMNEAEILAAVDGNFDGVLGDLETRLAPETEGVQGAKGDVLHHDRHQFSY